MQPSYILPSPPKPTYKGYFQQQRITMSSKPKTGSSTSDRLPAPRQPPTAHAACLWSLSSNSLNCWRDLTRVSDLAGFDQACSWTCLGFGQSLGLGLPPRPASDLTGALGLAL